MGDAPPSQPSPTRDDAEEPSGVEADEQPESVQTPQPDPEPEPEAVATPAQESEPPSQTTTPQRGSGRPSIVPRKRRLGRPPKIKPPDWDLPDDGEPAPAPVRRGRGRGRPSASGGGRWGKSKGGPSHVTQAPIDKDGNVMNVLNDEVELPEDEEGETKVDKLGNLTGGREYRVRTFTIHNRGDRLYMLSTEPARCIGFRDSYLFFQKHRLLYKIIIDDDAKRDLINRNIIPHSYKGRAIGVVTARSVFREFGAKIIIGGRKVTDDYGAKEARERGDVEGEIAVPDDRLPGPGETYDRNRYVAWHGASSVYHSGAPSVPVQSGKVVDPKKRKVIVTGDNWMVEHAREASRFNSTLSTSRKENMQGTYDIHTNMMQFPRITQPTHARWEPVPPPDEPTAEDLTNDFPTLHLTNGTSKAISNQPANESSRPPSSSRSSTPTPPDTIFTPIPPIYSRNFTIHDIHYETPANTSLGLPGPDGDALELGFGGSIPSAEDEESATDKEGDINKILDRCFANDSVLAELPPECRAAYREAAEREWEWKKRWGGETRDGLRSESRRSYVWFP
ncbi:hypothetical protein FQN54_008462 [Arachnomyces sp. PD_36]|nr:hypothetical protein FQN54_008462 [Arachnomyces sp. PD_36]